MLMLSYFFSDLTGLVCARPLASAVVGGDRYSVGYSPREVHPATLAGIGLFVLNYWHGPACCQMVPSWLAIVVSLYASGADPIGRAPASTSTFQIWRFRPGR